MEKTVGIIVGTIDKGAGTERAVVNLSNILSGAGYKVRLISLFTTEEKRSYYELDERVLIIHLGDNPQKGLNRLIFFMSLPKRIRIIDKREHFDFLLGTIHAVNCVILFSRIKAKIIACEHMCYDAAPFVSKVVRRAVYPFMYRVVLLTEADKNKYNFIPNNKVCVIPNSLSFKCETPSRLNNKRIITIGRLTRQKGFDLLIQASKKFFMYVNDWTIDIFGEGEDERKLLNMIQEYGLQDKVLIHPPTQNIKEELLNSGFFVCSSRWEGFSLVLMEAIECGLPVVGFDCPEGPGEIIIDGDNGYLVEEENVEMLADNMIKIAMDEDLQKKLGENAYRSAERYSSDVICKKWEKVFE